MGEQESKGQARKSNMSNVVAGEDSENEEETDEEEGYASAPAQSSFAHIVPVAGNRKQNSCWCCSCLLILFFRNCVCVLSGVHLCVLWI